MTGLDLRLRRTAARVSVTELANAMLVTPSRVSHIESRDRVTDDAQEKYLRALATLATVPTPPMATEVPA
jgi:transcriptional regulator with XRE-family HTH domain